MKQEYRVVWKRHGLKPKTKRYATLKAAERFLIVLGPEPWNAFRQKPDDYQCCNGHYCGCAGQTVREHFEDSLREVPPIESVRIEAREVGKWS